ncbi:MAG: TrmH family RNA methyltransferase [Pseudomonadota bacterium]
MVSRKCREELRRERQHSLKRYEKHRRRNLLAEAGVHQFVVVLDHLKAGFNVPKIFRSAEAFGAHEVHLVGIGPFDPSPAKGSFKNVPARFHETFDDCYQALREQGYRLFTLEPECGGPLSEVELPEKSAFIFGHEEIGISFDRANYPEIRCMHIPQFGQMESLNVSVAASIVMYEYVRRLPAKKEALV